jgi:hypothetical protein
MDSCVDGSCGYGKGVRGLWEYPHERALREWLRVGGWIHAWMVRAVMGRACVVCGGIRMNGALRE